MRKIFAVLMTLGLGLATMLGIASSAGAEETDANAQSTTVIWSPHPDDETLRLSALITQKAVRGDKIILVAVTDGEATYVSRAWGADPRNLADLRVAEQTFAIRELSNSRNVEIIRMQLPDGGVNSGPVRDLANKLDGPNVKHYCACDTRDKHRDHKAVAIALKRARLSYTRCSLSSTEHRRGREVQPAMSIGWLPAHNSYRAVGWTSVPRSFDEASDEPSSRIRRC